MFLTNPTKKVIKRGSHGVGVKITGDCGREVVLWFDKDEDYREWFYKEQSSYDSGMAAVQSLQLEAQRSGMEHPRGLGNQLGRILGRAL